MPVPVWMLPICLGISYLIRLSSVSGRIFQAQSKVVWSDANVACQQANGTLFMPDNESFDMQLFEDLKLDGDSWVAATYTFVSDPETSIRMIEPNARDRCIAFEIGQDCTGNYWHKSCNEKYSTICESYPATDRQWLLGRDMTWISASDLCQSRSLKMATFITNTRQFFDQGPCEPGFYWTGRVIEVALQSNTQSPHRQGDCGFLQNHILSFGNCSRMIHPLCVTGTDSLQNDTITRTSLFGEITSSSRDLPRMTQITPTNSDITGTDMQMERDIDSTSFQDEAVHLSDTGVIIGLVLGGAILILLIVLIVFILRKRLEKGKARKDAAKEMNSGKSSPNKTQNSTISVDDPGMAVLPPATNNAGYASDARNSEGRNDNILIEISKPNDSNGFSMDIKADDDDNNQLKTIPITPNRYESIHIDDDNYDHVEFEKKHGGGNASKHVYDKANFHLRDESIIQGGIVYDTTGECNTCVDKHDGQYDNSKHSLFTDNNTNHFTASEKDSV